MFHGKTVLLKCQCLMACSDIFYELYQIWLNAFTNASWSWSPQVSKCIFTDQIKFHFFIFTFTSWDTKNMSKPDQIKLSILNIHFILHIKCNKPANIFPIVSLINYLIHFFLKRVKWPFTQPQKPRQNYPCK